MSAVGRKPLYQPVGLVPGLKLANLYDMTPFIPFSREQALLLPPDAKDWLPADDVAHFVVAAVDRAPLGAFAVRPIPGGRDCRGRAHPLDVRHP